MHADHTHIDEEVVHLGVAEEHKGSRRTHSGIDDTQAEGRREEAADAGERWVAVDGRRWCCGGPTCR